MTIGEKIKFYRRKLKFTQKQLGERCNIAEITIRQYEAGKYIPKIGNLQKIANALNAPLKELLDVNGEQDWEGIARDFPDTHVLQNKDGIRAPMFTDELYPYRENIKYLIEQLNLDGLIVANTYISKLLKQENYLNDEPPTTE